MILHHRIGYCSKKLVIVLCNQEFNRYRAPQIEMTNADLFRVHKRYRSCLIVLYAILLMSQPRFYAPAKRNALSSKLARQKMHHLKAKKLTFWR